MRKASDPGFLSGRETLADASPSIGVQLNENLVELNPIEKYHGAENDFLFMELGSKDYSSALAQLSSFAQKICARNTGLGADGFVVWEAFQDGPYRMSIWNADGSSAATCGNALRCFALLLVRRGLWNGHASLDVKRYPEEGNENFAKLLSCTLGLETESSATASVVLGSLQAAIKLPLEQVARVAEASFQATLKTSLGLPAYLEAAWFIKLANPHVVLQFKNESNLKNLELIAEASGASLKKSLQNAKIVHEDVNLGFLCPEGQRLNLVVHERGAGVTRACGSGAAAAAFSLFLSTQKSKGNVQALQPTPPYATSFQMPGGKISICLNETPSSKDLTSVGATGYEQVAIMEGPCVSIFEAKMSHQAGFRLPRSSSS